MSVTWVACRSGMRGVLQEHWCLPKWFYQWRRPLTLPEMVNCLSFLRDGWGLFIPLQSMMECWWPRLMQTVTASVSSRVKDITQNSSLNFWSSCLHPSPSCWLYRHVPPPPHLHPHSRPPLLFTLVFVLFPREL